MTAKSKPPEKKTAVAKKTRVRKSPRNRKFGLEVVESEDDLTISLLQVDITEAQKTKPDDVNDETNFLSCVIAQAVTRSCGAERVAILRSKAYVAFPGDGKTRRYLIDQKSRGVLEAWDRGEPVLEGVKLKLLAPGPGSTLAAHAKRYRQRRKEGNKQASGPHGGRKRPDPLHNIVRNGNLVRWS
jgi:hypothetical protein